MRGTSAGDEAAQALRRETEGAWSPSFPHYEEVDVSLEPEDEVALQGPGSASASVSSKVVLTLGLQQTPVRNGVSIVVTSVRPGSTLARTGLVREGALLLAIDGASAEKLRGRELRKAVQSGARRRATFFSPMQASLRASPKQHAMPLPEGIGAAGSKSSAGSNSGGNSTVQSKPAPYESGSGASSPPEVRLAEPD